MDASAQIVANRSAADSIVNRARAKGRTTCLPELAQLTDRPSTLPLPGSGRTLERWRRFSAISAIDLTSAKLFESHTDALAILHELGASNVIRDDELWAVWCAEPASHKVFITFDADESGTAYLNGIKAWCSGADVVSHALVSCWDTSGKSYLAAVSMDQAAVSITREGWAAVGMGDTDSVDVAFDHAIAIVVGQAGSYVNRPGFVHGAAGVAACWYGAAAAIADYVFAQAGRRPNDAHVMAHLGAIDVALRQAACLLHRAASVIDASPSESCTVAVQRARLAVESAVEIVLQRAPRALGAGPLCKNAHLAHLFADLPVFVRQSHAERDLAALGRTLIECAKVHPWTL